MNRTRIEYLKGCPNEPYSEESQKGFTWNPITGCTAGCPYCYARKIATRFGKSFEPEFHPDRLGQPAKHKQPSRIMVCSMGDFWEEGITNDQRFKVFKIMTSERYAPQHKYLILTKKPQKMWRSPYDPEYWYPDNLWQGVSVTCADDLWRIEELIKRVPARRVVSFEPLLEDIADNMSVQLHKILSGIDWVIIGGLTPLNTHKSEWIQDIIYEARYAGFNKGMPIFVKNNANYEHVGAPLNPYPKNW